MSKGTRIVIAVVLAAVAVIIWEARTATSEKTGSGIIYRGTGKQVRFK